ncbi:MAG: MgtC/SapB family protein [Thermoproteota archaeon]
MVIINYSEIVEPLISLVLAIVFGAIVGFEREKAHKPAGLRTHMLVCLGSCLFTIVSLDFSIEPARIAAGIVTGIGFIGAGAIIAEQDKVVGITTAASLWVTAAIGLAIGVGSYMLAAMATLLVFLVLSSRILFRRIQKQK